MRHQEKMTIFWELIHDDKDTVSCAQERKTFDEVNRDYMRRGFYYLFLPDRRHLDDQRNVVWFRDVNDEASVGMKNFSSHLRERSRDRYEM